MVGHKVMAMVSGRRVIGHEVMVMISGCRER